MFSAEEFHRTGSLLISDAFRAEDRRIASGAFCDAAGMRQNSMPEHLVQWLCNHRGLNGLAETLCANPCRLVRIIAFDKSPHSNWFVPWHQDRTIAVREEAEVEGYAHWTFKDGLHHAEPPIEVLESMVTLRLHIDDCGPDSGPLEVIDGTHVCGRLDKAQISEIVSSTPSRVLLAAESDVIAMRPLLLHRSKRSSGARRRRVLHLEYSFADLPAPLSWALN